MIQTTRWSPDTCQCVIDFQWDDSVALHNRIHTPSSSVKQCLIHTGLNLTTHWNRLSDENPRKNKLINHLRTQHPSQFAADGIFSGSYTFDVNGVLTLTLPTGLSGAQKNTLRDWCTTNLGTGKVIVK